VSRKVISDPTWQFSFSLVCAQHPSAPFTFAYRTRQSIKPDFYNSFFSGKYFRDKKIAEKKSNRIPFTQNSPKVFGVKFGLTEIERIVSIEIRNFKLWKMPKE